MIYDLSSEFDRKRAETRFRSLLDKNAKVELTEVRKRTLNQNRYLHLILGWFAHEYGCTMEYAKRNYFKRLCNPDIFMLLQEDAFLGKIETLISSKAITPEQMSLAIERFRNWSASEGGIYLPSANEKGFLDMIEIEMSRDRRYL